MKNLRVELYTKTQKELDLHIKEILKEKNIDYKELKEKGIWSVRFENKPVFVAHLDTVNKSDDEFKKPLLIEDGKLSRPNYVLGADDRAGVALILNHIDDINFIFTWDEEIGCVGANALSLNAEFITDCKKGSFFVELDRRNGNDLLGNKHGYCTKELADKLLAVLPNFKDTSGVHTDIDSFKEIMQGVNMSVGYYKAHSSSEFLVIEEFENVNSLIPEINKVEHERELPPKKSYSYFGKKGSKTYGGYFGGGNSDVCDCCGDIVYHTYKVKGENLCWSCKSYKEKRKSAILTRQLEEGIIVPETATCVLCGGDIMEDDEAYSIGDNNFLCTTCVTPVLTK